MWFFTHFNVPNIVSSERMLRIIGSKSEDCTLQIIHVSLICHAISAKHIGICIGDEHCGVFVFDQWLAYRIIVERSRELMFQEMIAAFAKTLRILRKYSRLRYEWTSVRLFLSVFRSMSTFLV